jgi:hypothetical protein
MKEAAQAQKFPVRLKLLSVAGFLAPRRMACASLPGKNAELNRIRSPMMLICNDLVQDLN